MHARPETTSQTIVQPHPLRAFGEHGEIIGLSYDGARSWVRTPQGAKADSKRQEPLKVEYKAKVAAALLDPTPSFERRVIATFPAFGLVSVLGGWGTVDYLATMPAGELDILTLPGIGVPMDVLADLKSKIKAVVLDLDEPFPGQAQDRELLAATAAHVDVITVPTKLMADELRKRHPSVYVVPPVIDAAVWKGLKRPPKNDETKIRIGVTNPGQTKALDLALEQVIERFGDRIELLHYNWWELRGAKERGFYPSLDIAIVGTIGRYNSTYPALAAAAGGAAVIAGRGFGRTVNHGHNGLVVGRDTDHKAWRRAMCDLLLDARQRNVLARNARNEVRKATTQQHVGEIVLPYKLLATGRMRGR